MYRPEEWDNPHKLRKGQLGITDPNSPRVLLVNAYEAGADAILKALVGNGWLEEYNMVDEAPEEE